MEEKIKSVVGKYDIPDNTKYFLANDLIDLFNKTNSKQVQVGVMRKFNGRIYYRVYWYKELNLKREEHFTTKEAAIIKYTEIGKDYLYAGIEEIQEQTKLLGYLHSGIEQIEISA